MLEDIKQVYDKKNKRSLDLMTMEVTYVYGDKMFQSLGGSRRQSRLS